jgi:Protein of unknown function (DUF3168)
MTYAAASALQSAVFARLTGFPALAGVSVVDALAPGSGTGTYILLGPETASDRSDRTGPGAEHVFLVSVLSDDTGFLAAKTIAGHVSEALAEADLTLTTGQLVYLHFQRAQARRLREGSSRRIDLTFRARVEI